MVGTNHISGTAEARMIKFLYTSRLCQVPAYEDESPLKGAWSGSRGSF